MFCLQAMVWQKRSEPFFQTIFFFMSELVDGAACLLLGILFPED
jgi:hypothetical protein